MFYKQMNNLQNKQKQQKLANNGTLKPKLKNKNIKVLEKNKKNLQNTKINQLQEQQQYFKLF